MCVLCVLCVCAVCVLLCCGMFEVVVCVLVCVCGAVCGGARVRQLWGLCVVSVCDNVWHGMWCCVCVWVGCALCVLWVWWGDSVCWVCVMLSVCRECDMY